MIEATVDTSQLERKLSGIIGKMVFNKPIQESLETIRFSAIDNFDTQGFTYGNLWQPLNEKTKKQRESLGFGGARPILERSGKLKYGFKIGTVTAREGSVYNEVSYAPYHQYGAKNIPRRTILMMSSKIMKAVNLIFANYIAQVIKAS